MTLPSDTSENNRVQNEKEKVSRTPWPLVVTVICTMCGQVATGICGGALNSPEDFIKHFMNETAISRGQDPLSDDRLTSYYALLSALVPLGSVIGSPLTQYTADTIGRKLLLLVSAVLGVVAALLMGLSVEFRSPEMLFAGRVMAGVMCGDSVTVAHHKVTGPSCHSPDRIIRLFLLHRHRRSGVLLRERADVSGVVAARGQVLNPSIYLGRHHRVSHPCLYRWAPEATVLMLGGLAGMLLAQVVLTIALLYQGQAVWLSTVAVVSSFALGMFHAAGPAQVPWILLPEIFDAEARGAASSIGVTVMNASSFVMTYAFPPLQKYCGAYSILLFVGTSALFFMFFFFLQPETMRSFAKEKEETQNTVEGPEERTQL
ncbi:solute carrier family 2, facilitated glucose transporter member 1-like [Pomacea canaliculata]|uniref:solute carrier family 2, facilitated glucose transporter member 1-like n=1 Tax=Pomacea canaliculata TaxID=400727 RepID=UPI000D730BD5|nr:solute carrier family 2, facilitated glucose transporter member 1-like [Pomacea canaliculata]